MTRPHLPAILFLLAATACATVGAAPYVPADDRQVVERRPVRSDPAQREIAALRKQLSARKDELPVALELARRYILLARADGDPRYLGYAQAALAPWWDAEQPPVQVRVLRATLYQSTHRFDRALADLDSVLKEDRRNAQAWLTRATVLQVQGKFEQAKRSCAQLRSLAPALVAIACLANAESLSGQGAKSYTSLREALKRSPDGGDPNIRAWVLTLLAEIALREGHGAAAEAHFREALALDATDTYLLAAYADFLLDHGRHDEVVRLLQPYARVDSLLLRYALALDAQGSPAAAEHTGSLRARFAAAAMREDTVHQREQARFELALMKRPAQALELAKRNWVIQKEPADARILLESAAAAGDKRAARPVISWLKEAGMEDRALAPLVHKLDEGRS